jgi:hypothetical protein
VSQCTAFASKRPHPQQGRVGWAAGEAACGATFSSAADQLAGLIRPLACDWQRSARMVYMTRRALALLEI